MNHSPGAGPRVFDAFRFDPATGELDGPDRAQTLRPQAALTLELLISRAGTPVTRDELRAALWPDERVVMFEGSIAAVVRELRRALGDDPKSPRYIETLPRRGYRFIGPGADMSPAKPLEPAAARGRADRRVIGGFLHLSQALAMAMTILLPAAIGDLSPVVLDRPDEHPTTVAVLPFEESTPSILSEEVARELIGRLGAAAPGRLRVVDASAAGANERSRADYVLRGSVGTLDDGRNRPVVISAQLLTGAGGAFVWGRKYRREPADPGLTVREVSALIADGVLSNTVNRPRTRPAGTVASDAADAQFRAGLASLGQLSVDKTRAAVAAFRGAARLDPEFAAAHAHLAEALIAWTGPPVTDERVEQARRAAMRAIELDPLDATAHRVLGEIALYFDRDWTRAGDLLKRSVALSPSDASGHDSYAAWLAARGRHDESLREIELAEALDPASVAISIDAMLIHYYARDFKGTLQAARRLEQLWPENPASRRYAVLSLIAQGDVAGAAAEARAAFGAGGVRGEPGVSASDAEALEAFWRTGLGAVRRHLREYPGDPSVLSIFHTQLGQVDQAIDALDTGLAGGAFSYLLPYVGVSPAFDGLCGDPRFERLLRELSQSALSTEGVDARCADAMRTARLGRGD